MNQTTNWCRGGRRQGIWLLGRVLEDDDGKPCFGVGLWRGILEVDKVETLVLRLDDNYVGTGEVGRKGFGVVIVGGVSKLCDF